MTVAVTSSVTLRSVFRIGRLREDHRLPVEHDDRERLIEAAGRLVVRRLTGQFREVLHGQSQIDALRFSRANGFEQGRLRIDVDLTSTGRTRRTDLAGRAIQHQHRDGLARITLRIGEHQVEFDVLRGRETTQHGAATPTSSGALCERRDGAAPLRGNRRRSRRWLLSLALSLTLPLALALLRLECDGRCDRRGRWRGRLRDDW